MHLSRRSLRHITRMILAMWLFALGAGVANACLLNTTNDSNQSSFSVASPGAPGAHAHQKELPDPGTAGCLKFCDEPRLAITKLDQPISDGGAVMVGTLTRALAPASASATADQLPVLSHRPAHLALPIAARPHRLTL
ncbi:hypothetical protein [Hydrogenophaga sp.]|uniref:hypothetical protein n=1 Tax=Hydrogenophaga sp. TaxID=1904254 RepID=UPI002718AABA|nr:hypothetical protein [Hydrogenophaga sp.]MDO8906732.1 hypothetical protein [Hydrogenophaga sp.]